MILIIISLLSSVYYSSFILMAVWIMILWIFIRHQLKWVNNLEAFSQHLLETSGNQKTLQTTTSLFPSVIGHAINQLILNNTKLIKSKSDLAEQIRKTSYIDDVTGLGNHLFFKAELEVRLHNHGEAESGLVVIFSFIDEGSKDRKKLTEEQLVAITQVFKLYITEINHSLVARLKQSEFVLLLPNFTEDKTDQFCKKLIKQLVKTVFNKTTDDFHFVDVGISTYKQGFGYYNVMAETDMALRNAQLQGANSWFVYGEALPKNQSKGRLLWQSFLQNVLNKRQIILFSQNIYYLSESSPEPCSGPDSKEVILHKEIFSKVPDGNNVIAADTFVAMALHCGLASAFDRQVIDNMIKQCLYQQDKDSQTRYTVNLFASSLLDKPFTHWLIAKLSSYPKLNQSIIFEVTENSLIKNIDEVAAIMQQLASLGVNWSVDHFGSPDDLSYLSKAPISMVKVDRRIIHNIATSSVHQLLLSSIIASCNLYKIKVFAEGIEKQADADYLKSVKLEGLQGYYFDRPERLTIIPPNNEL